VVPVAGDVESLELVHAGLVKASVPISQQPPVINGLTATPGDDGVRITWIAVDPDSDKLTASVLWSADGQTWFPLALDTTATSVLVGSGVLLPGGPAVVVKVIATDGVRTTESVSAPFTVAAHAPVVAVGELPDGSRIPRYYLGELTALGYDAEDGNLPGTSIAWGSDRDGGLGTGGVLSLRWLSAGEHTITATATDSSGATAVDTIRLSVVDTGAPAPRRQGAEPEAERRLLAATAEPRSGWLWAVLVGAGLAAAAVGAWTGLRARHRTRAAAGR
jgi:hypothetical protein